MALWGDKKTSDFEEFLLKENESLKKQIERLQEALIAKESPVAYQQMQVDKLDYESEVPEDLTKLKEEAEFIRRAAIAQEQPFFADAEDMVSKLSAIVGINPPDSIHDNEES